MSFDPASAVNTSNNTITLTTAQCAALADGDQVTYNSNSNTAVGGLVNNTVYKVFNKTSTTVQLSQVASNPQAAINLTSVGSGTGHKLTGQTATVDLTKTDGKVKSIEIGEKGFGYTGSQVSVSFTGTAASGQSTTTPVATIGLTSDGELDGDAITISNEGGGFAQLFGTIAANPNATKISKIRVLGPSQKNFRTAPTVVFPQPDAKDADGNLLSTNVTATAVFTLDSNGLITSGDITPSNPGLGYTRDPIVTLESGAQNELRARNQKEILILSLNHNMTNIHNGFNHDNFQTIINNGYKQRKGDFYGTPRLFNSNQQISFLGGVEIQNVDSNNINKYNTRTFVEIE